MEAWISGYDTDEITLDMDFYSVDIVKIDGMWCIEEEQFTIRNEAVGYAIYLLNERNK